MSEDVFAQRIAEAKQHIYKTELIITPPEGAGRGFVSKGIIPISIEYQKDFSDLRFRAEVLKLVVEGIEALIDNTEEEINQDQKENA